MSKQSIPILCLTLKAAGTIAANRLVAIDVTLAGAGVNTLGVTRVAAASGDYIPVDIYGTTVVESGAAVSVGDTIKSDATGRAITWVTSGAKVGIALDAASASGQFIEMLLIPNAA